MNYYNHHIGDYITKTIHLSLEQHGAYRRMMDIYYSTEEPLPLDVDLICRKIPTHTESEKSAVIYILSQHEFFEKRDDGYHNEHCDAVIRLWKRNRDNGKFGGRPLKKERGEENPEKTQKKPKQEPKQEPKVKPNSKPRRNPPNTQYPIPNTQEREDIVSPDGDTRPRPLEEDGDAGFSLSKKPKVPYDDIKKAYHEICVALPRCKTLSDKRKRMLDAAWRTAGKDMSTIREALTKAQASPFLRGERNKPDSKNPNFRADFEFVFTEKNFSNILDGRYDDNGNAGSDQKKKKSAGEMALFGETPDDGEGEQQK